MLRTTLANTRFFEGVGLHCGRPCSAALHPARSGYGVRFNGVRATLDAVDDARLATTVAGVSTVEHLLAALFALGVDDVEIRVEGGEVPILDGSAAPWADLPLESHPGTRRPLRPGGPVEVRDGAAFVRLEPAGRLELDVSVDFPGVGPQRYVTDDPRDCLDARTFGWARDAAALHAAGRALGASPENVLVVDREPPASWRYPNELARHKCLDLLGDLALLGRPLVARVIASGAGHALHHALVRATTDALSEEAP